MGYSVNQVSDFTAKCKLLPARGGGYINENAVNANPDCQEPSPSSEMKDFGQVVKKFVFSPKGLITAVAIVTFLVLAKKI